MGDRVANVSVFVPDEMKRKMDEYRIINWSEVARGAFSETISEMGMLKKIAGKSKLRESDALKIGRRINAGVARRHEEKLKA